MLAHCHLSAMDPSSSMSSGRGLVLYDSNLLPSVLPVLPILIGADLFDLLLEKMLALSSPHLHLRMAHYIVGFLLIFCLVSNDLTLVIIGRRARRDTQEKNGEKRRTAVSNRKKEREREAVKHKLHRLRKSGTDFDLINRKTLRFQ
ncbi:hypothetical protein OUZ56_021122 [Daphnia magna]|uniref:Uncharacterized protein n=1 Tax=Daphnia magna TaxID=35525 RepID=A0ABQ9ZGI1_9CRUS|nr:hypothetical protein OUZ56_021122 [Daphnia magna]